MSKRSRRQAATARRQAARTPAVPKVDPRILVGSCLDRLKELPDASIDSIVTDPPYELGFMGKKWDASGIAYSVELWEEALRVLKPGGHLLAFGGSRTYHRMTVAIEDAGFEIRDSLHWTYGSGFPKSLDVSKAIDKSTGENRARQLQFTAWMRSTGITATQINDATGTSMGGHYLTDAAQPAIATADLFDKLRHLLPDVPEAIERLVAERTGIEWTAYKNRPVVGTTVGTRLEFAPGESRARTAVEIDLTAPATDAAQQWSGWGTALKPSHEPIVVARKPLAGTVAATVLEYGTGALNVDGCRVGSGTGEKRTVALPDIRGGKMHAAADRGTVTREVVDQGRWPANTLLTHSALCDGAVHAADCPVGELDAQSGTSVLSTQTGGGASRFFPTFSWDPVADVAPFLYQAKPSKAERNAGLEALPPGKGVRTNAPRSSESEKTKARQNFHPTVKPVALMRWLVRLVTPLGGTVLDPFLGSGTTAIAATLEGFEWKGCELTAEYVPIIEARTKWATKERAKLLAAPVKPAQKKRAPKVAPAAVIPAQRTPIVPVVPVTVEETPALF